MVSTSLENKEIDIFLSYVDIDKGSRFKFRDYTFPVNTGQSFRCCLSTLKNIRMASDGNSPHEHPAVTSFREYIRIKSVHPTPDYDGCLDFLKRYGALA